MVGVLYADGDQMYGGWLATLLGLMIILGEIASGFAARHIGKVKYQVITTLALGGIFFACKKIAHFSRSDLTDKPP